MPKNSDYYKHLLHQIQNSAQVLSLAWEMGGSKADAKLLDRIDNELIYLKKLLLKSAFSAEKFNIPSTFDLYGFTNQAIQKNYVGTDIKWTFNYNEIDLALVYVDFSILNEIFRILLDNIEKYTPKNGEVIFKISETPDQFLLEITNTKISLTAEQIQDFDNLESPATCKHGNGLGVKITKKLAQQIDIKLSITSNHKDFVKTSLLFEKLKIN